MRNNLFNNNSIHAKTDNGSNVQFKGEIKALEQDTFEESKQNPYTVVSIQNDDYEGYLDFKIGENEQKYRATYQFNDAGNPPKFKPGDKFNAKLTICNLMSIKNFEEESYEEETMLEDHRNAMCSPSVYAVGRVVSKLNDYDYELEINGLPKTLTLETEGDVSYKKGDLLEVMGYLKCNFEEE